MNAPDTLVELPGNDGRILAVNPLHVTAVQPMEGPLSGRTGMYPMSAVWVQGRNVFICAWQTTDVLRVLNGARNALAKAFEAGVRAGYSHGTLGVEPTGEDIESDFNEWKEPLA